MRRAPVDTLATLLGDETLTLPADTAHYLLNVLRLGAGERVELFDGRGLVVTVCLAEGDTHRIEDITRHDTQDSAVTLCQAIPKGDRWAWILEKCTELGVAAFQPILSARTVVKISHAKQGKKLERWHKIAQAAARQSLRPITPEVHAPLTPEAALTQGALHIVAALHHEPTPLREVIKARAADQRICLWAGPEGGWTQDELARFEEAGAYFVTLGHNVLRADTAAVSLLTLTMFLIREHDS